MFPLGHGGTSCPSEWGQGFLLLSQLPGIFSDMQITNLHNFREGLLLTLGSVVQPRWSGQLDSVALQAKSQQACGHQASSVH
jgi:hypothetical protein